MWVYFDESGEYEQHRLVNMTVAGCIATFEAWQAFDPLWKKALDDEGVDCFHMVDFEAYAKPFDWYLPDGSKDVARHNRFLDRLLTVMLDHSTEFFCFNNFPVPGKRQHREAYKRGVKDTISECHQSLAHEYDSKINLVFARHPEFKEVLTVFDEINWGPERLGTCTVACPTKVRQLQAADLVAYEMARVQRPDKPVRYPYRRIKERATKLLRGTKWDNARWDTMPWN